MTLWQRLTTEEVHDYLESVLIQIQDEVQGATVSGVLADHWRLAVKAMRRSYPQETAMALDTLSKNHTLPA